MFNSIYLKLHAINFRYLGSIAAVVNLGMWAAKVFHQRNQIVRAAGTLLDRDHWHEKGCDQDLLAQFLWPVFKHSVVKTILSFFYFFKTDTMFPLDVTRQFLL
jgi:hypothetical protein